MTQPPPPPSNLPVPAAQGRAGLPELPSFMTQFAHMFTMPTAEELSNARDPMVIASISNDGILKVKKKGDTIATLLPGGMLLGLPIAYAKPNVLFENEKSKEPSCKSDDGIIGIGDIHDGSGHAADRECAKCPAFQWRSDPKGGKGKWCKSSVIVAMSCAGIMLKEHEGQRYVKVSTEEGGDHGWWYRAYDLTTENQWQKDQYEHPGPIIIRMTSSSFPAWEKALADIKKIHATGAWPIEGTIWAMQWEKSASKSGHDVGVWKFQIAAVGEPEAWLLALAVSIKEHPSIERLGTAGHEAEGTIRHV